jgi:uncharacterized membrane protein (DUF2068 family)
MDRESTIKCIQVAFNATKLEDAAGGDLSKLSEPVRTFLIVNGAQGVIDNGGYRFFFGADWPDNPPYENFAAAYEAIGCWKQAADLRRVVETFPFPDPHLHKERRCHYIEENLDEETHSVRGWGDGLCGDDEVWKKLAAYSDWHRPHFQVEEKLDLPILRFPTQHARQADHMAVIVFLGGIYFLWNLGGVIAELKPWFAACGVVSIVAGVLLWLRVPHAKWLGVLTGAVLLGIFARSLVLKGFSLFGGLQLLMPVACIYWMARIDYNHVFHEEDDE